jgi:hypothetical protein
MRVIVAESGAMVLQFAKLRKELFHPSGVTNAATDEHLVELAKVAAQGILDELHDEKKATLGSICLFADLLFLFRDVLQRLRRH